MPYHQVTQHTQGNTREQNMRLIVALLSLVYLHELDTILCKNIVLFCIMDMVICIHNYYLPVFTLLYLEREDSNGLNRSNHFFSRDKHLSSRLEKTLKTFYCNLANKNRFDTGKCIFDTTKILCSFIKLQSICVKADKSPDFINTTHIIPESTQMVWCSLL